MRATTFLIVALLLVLCAFTLTTFAEEDTDLQVVEEAGEGADAEDAPGAALVINSLNFKSQLDEHKTLLIMFYAPWCGHCKSLKPTWEKAAEALKGKVAIAKVDCTKHNDVCSEYEVKGFPTIKLVTSDGTVIEYTGDRSFDDIVRFASKVTRPSLTDITTAEALQTFLSQQAVSFLFVGDEIRTRAAGIAKILLASHSCAFIPATNVEIVKQYTTQSPALISVAPDDTQVLSGEALTDEAITVFMFENQFGLIPELSPANFAEMQKLKKPITIVAVKPSEAEAMANTLAIARAVADKKRKPFAYTWLNAEKWGQYLSTHYGIHDDELPQAVVLDHIGNKYYRTRVTDEPSLASWMSAVEDGTVPAVFLDPEMNKTQMQMLQKQIEDYIKAFPLFVTISAFFIGFIVGKIPLGSRSAKKRTTTATAAKAAVAKKQE